ncbi:MAG: cytochrome c3 family protein [Actinomycetota bacterium]|jgi:hypothetical protein|nr:cytochrome c3 family protein [Actinomycetota bacterium]
MVVAVITTASRMTNSSAPNMEMLEMERSAKLGFVATLTACLVLAAASVAFAYPGELPDYSGDLSRTQCVDCHGASAQALLNPGSDPVLLAGVRKGPHGGYTTGTNKCQTCHSLHDAPADGSSLLPGETIKNTCESCHDGTAGTAVYGVIMARTGLEPASAHRIEVTSTIPGGDAGGGSLTGSFMGPDGTLTCSDCHASHGAHTVDPFTGDRLRSSVSSDTAYDIKTDRLLKQAPTGSETTVTVYGAGWCATCHAGRATQHAPESGALADHPVIQDDAYTYDRLPVVKGVGSIETTIGGLGQSNRGYVMPGPALGEPTQKTALQEGAAPLCQQCHEDLRTTGPSVRETNPTLTSAGQEFLVTQPDGSNATDNPRFQVFPHESDAENLLVREPEPAEPNSLCLNCHSLVHDATPGSDYVEVFDGKHDDASFPSDGITAPCATCHVTHLLPVHDDLCSACHSSPYDTLGTWNGGCQEGGCHTSYHLGPFNAHFDAYDDGDCTTCHPTGWWPTVTQCVACHASPSSVSPPVTSSNAQATYVGAARIEFALTKGGKAAIGTTYYRVDGGATFFGKSALIIEDGAHTIEFWSVDQGGIVESPTKTANFTITADTTPPITTSNALTQYYSNAYITLAPTDASSMGVKATYYTVDGGPTNTGTFITVPAVTGVVPHTVTYWSEDWSGNVEAPHTANFTITYGTATLRLVWGGTPPAGAWADWYIYTNASWTTLFTSGSDGGAGWTGINDVALPVRATPYYVRVDWGYDALPWGDDQTNVGPVSLTVPGAIVTEGY